MQMKQGCKDAGFAINNKMLTKLTNRYVNEDGLIELCDFITCIIRLELLIGESTRCIVCLNLTFSPFQIFLMRTKKVASFSTTSKSSSKRCSVLNLCYYSPLNKVFFHFVNV